MASKSARLEKIKCGYGSPIEAWHCLWDRRARLFLLASCAGAVYDNQTLAEFARRRFGALPEDIRAGLAHSFDPEVGVFREGVIQSLCRIARSFEQRFEEAAKKWSLLDHPARIQRLCILQGLNPELTLSGRILEELKWSSHTSMRGHPRRLQELLTDLLVPF